MIDNRTLIQKADLALADLLTSGGALVPAQARRFIRTLIEESVIMPLSTVVPMRSNKQRLERIRFGSRVLRAGTEGQALGSADRSKPDLSKSELDAQLFKAEVRLNNEVLEDSIERQTLRQTILAIMAERISLDMDEVIIQGDTTSGDPFLAKFDGIVKAASANVYDHLSAFFSQLAMKNLLKVMPNEFLRNKRRMRFFVGVDTEIGYRDALSNRETGVGDKFLEQDVPVLYSGVPIVDVPLFPETLGGSGDETVVLLTDPKNVNVGIWRKITIETDKDISAGVLVIVATLRFDVKFAEPTATAKATNVKVP